MTETASATAHVTPPHQSFFDHLKKFAKHVEHEAPHVLPYLEEIAQLAVKAGVHMSPQASIIVGAVSAVSAAVDAKKDAAQQESQPTTGGSSGASATFTFPSTVTTP